jgi:hypothetical protein
MFERQRFANLPGDSRIFIRAWRRVNERQTRRFPVRFADGKQDVPRIAPAAQGHEEIVVWRQRPLDHALKKAGVRLNRLGAGNGERFLVDDSGRFDFQMAAVPR